MISTNFSCGINISGTEPGKTRVVYVYELRLGSPQEVEMPRNGQIISVGVRNGNPAIWVVVDPEDIKTTRVFAVLPTGVGINERFHTCYGSVALLTSASEAVTRHPLPPGSPNQGAFMFHIFEGWWKK